MPYISVDTNVFIRLEGIYRNALKCLLATTDIVVVTKEILKEYRGRAKSSIFILQSFLRRLQQKGKLKVVKRSFVQSRIRRHLTRINYPSHHRDKKWVDITIAVKGRYIITTDYDLLNLAPNRCGGHLVDVVEPDRYRTIRCPTVII